MYRINICLLIGVSFLVVLYGCTRNDHVHGPISKGSFLLIPSDTIIFERDSTTYNFNHFHKLSDEFEEAFILGNTEGTALIYYDTNGRVLRKIKIPRGVPEGIFSQINGVYPYKPDSVFIFSGGYTYLTNDKGEIYTTWYALRMDITVDYGLTTSLPAVLFDSILIYPTYSFGLYRDIGLDWRLNIKANKSDDFPQLGGYYPEEMKEGAYVGFPYLENFRDILYDHSSIIYGLPGDPFLRVINSEGEETKFLAIPDNYIGGAPFKDEADARENGVNHARQRTFAKHIFSFVRYDPQKKYFYRAVYHPLSPNKIEAMSRQNYRKEMEFSILVFDSNTGEKIGSSDKFHGKDFNLSTQFAHEGGLYIQLLDDNEDEVSFIRFELNN